MIQRNCNKFLIFTMNNKTIQNIIIILLFYCCIFGCGQKHQSNLPAHIREKIEDSGIDNITRYWIGDYLYIDKDSTVHTTLNCKLYEEFPGYGHRNVICIDTANINLDYARGFCDLCVGDSLGYIIAKMIVKHDNITFDE